MLVHYYIQHVDADWKKKSSSYITLQYIYMKSNVHFYASIIQGLLNT